VIFALIMDGRTVSRDADFATESAGLDTKTGTDLKSVPSPFRVSSCNGPGLFFTKFQCHQELQSSA
jgi:hypothetical protein